MRTTETSRVWRIARGGALPLDRDVLIMGVVNVTPDSFSDGGSFYDLEAAVAQGVMLARTDADILDVGGESTRPGSQAVPPVEQIRRIVPVVKRLADECPDVAISVDTRSAQVAEAALAVGAHIVNDISALRDDREMGRLIAQSGAGVVLMHMQGTPATMQADPRYEDVVGQVSHFLRERVAFAISQGIEPDRIVIDPGIGFGKSLQHNLQLLANLDQLLSLGLPVMVGPSRKRFIGDLAGAPVNERLAGTLSACVMAVLGGARIVRVHNAAPVRQAIKVAQAIRQHERAVRA